MAHALRDDIKIALVCQSNLNRSMEAHAILNKHGYKVSSFGAGSKVRLPGEAIDKPNVYDFGTPYDHILADLKRKNARRYTKNGMIQMVDRDRKVKKAPERWQDSVDQHFDLVVTYEKRVYDIVVADLEQRETEESRPAHVVNLDTPDNHAEAKTASELTLKLVDKVYASEDWEDEMTNILDDYEAKYDRPVLMTVMFY
jgi:RNA polymerase II subunit A C-terminal domain phosphatase SSU72